MRRPWRGALGGLVLTVAVAVLVGLIIGVALAAGRG